MSASPFMRMQRDSLRKSLADVRAFDPSLTNELYSGVACGLALDMVDGVGPEGAATVFYAMADDIVAKHPRPFKMPPAPPVRPTTPSPAELARRRPALVPALLFPLGLAVGLILASLS